MDTNVGHNFIHYHDYLELLWVMPTSDTFNHILGNTVYTSAPGDFVLIPTCVNHRIQDTTSKSNGYLLNFTYTFVKNVSEEKYRNFFFDWGNLLPWLSRGDCSRLILKVPKQKQEEFHALFEPICNICFSAIDAEKERNLELISKYVSLIPDLFNSFAAQLSRHFYSSCSAEELTLFEKYRPPLLAALDYIDEHLCEQIKLSDVCSCAGLKTAWFSKIFRETIGFTVTDYINFIRARKARQLLVNTSMSMGEISEACGFASAIYFDRVFKRHTGCSPRVYRDEYVIEW